MSSRAPRADFTASCLIGGERASQGRKNWRFDARPAGSGTARRHPMIASFPPHGAGQRIGLYGGSFNPPHEGHRHVALMALRRLALDRLWLLVTPGNPLKNHDGLPSLEARLAKARSIMTHPRIDVSGVEAALGSDMTVDTVTALSTRASLASLRLDHGRRQSRKLPPLASLASPRRSRADGRHRPSGSDASGLALARRAGALTLPHPRISGPDARGTKPTRLGLLARAPVEPVLDRA